MTNSFIAGRIRRSVAIPTPSHQSIISHGRFHDPRAWSHTLCYSTHFLVDVAAAQSTPNAAISVERIRPIKSQLPPPPNGFTWHLYKNAVLPETSGMADSAKISHLWRHPSSPYTLPARDFSDKNNSRWSDCSDHQRLAQKNSRNRGEKMALIYLEAFFLRPTYKKERGLVLEQNTKGDF